MSGILSGLTPAGAQQYQQARCDKVSLLSGKLDAELTPQRLWIARLQSTNGLSGNLD